MCLFIHNCISSVFKEVTEFLISSPQVHVLEDPLFSGSLMGSFILSKLREMKKVFLSVYIIPEIEGLETSWVMISYRMPEIYMKYE